MEKGLNFLFLVIILDLLRVNIYFRFIKVNILMVVFGNIFCN